MFNLSVTILEAFDVEMRTTLTLTFTTSQGEMEISQSKGRMQLLIGWHFREIRSRNAHNSDLDLYSGPMRITMTFTFTVGQCA